MSENGRFPAHEEPPRVGSKTLTTTLVAQGKVRNIYAFHGLIFETSNRLSVFDRVVMEYVPWKGAMLNCISQHFKKLLSDRGIPTDYIEVPRSFFIVGGNFDKKNVGRLSYAKQLAMLPVEFIVRSYLTGSAYNAYQKGEAYCGYTFPNGMKNGSKLPNPIVTPTTKEENGHDRPVNKYQCYEHVANWLLANGYCYDGYYFRVQYEDNFQKFFNEVCSVLDQHDMSVAKDHAADLWDRAAYGLAFHYAKIYVDRAYEMSLEIFDIISEECDKAGIIFVDTKFEFGIDENNDVVLGDEVGTPDSSRFTSEEEYVKDGRLVSMDKQFVRDYYASVGFTGGADEEIPEAPEELREAVADKYLDIATKLCGPQEVQKYL